MGHQPREQTYRISQKQASSSLAHSSSTDHRIPGTSIINLNSHGSTHHLPGFDTTYVDRTQSLRTNATQRGFLQPGLSMVEDGPQTAPVVSQSSQSPSLHPVPYGASIFDFSSQISSQYNFGASDIPGTSVYRLNSYNSLASNQSPSMLPIGASIFNVNSRSMCSDYSADNHSNRSCNLPGTSLMDLYHNDSYRSLTRRPILLPGISLQMTQESFQVVDLNGDIVCTTTCSSPHHTPVNTPPFYYPSDAGGDDTIGGGDGSAGGGDNGNGNGDNNGSSSGGDNKVNSNNGGINVSSRGGGDIENVVKNDGNDIKVNIGYNDNVNIPNNNGNNKVNSNSLTTTSNNTNTNNIATSSNIGENSNKEVVTVSNIIVTFRGEDSGGNGDVNDGGGGGKDNGSYGVNNDGAKGNGGIGVNNTSGDSKECGKGAKGGNTESCGKSSTGKRDAAENLKSKNGCVNAVCDLKENKKENNDNENNKKDITNVEIPNSKKINVKDNKVNENSFNNENNIKENTNNNKNNIKETSNKNNNNKNNPNTNPNTKTDEKIDSKKCLVM